MSASVYTQKMAFALIRAQGLSVRKTDSGDYRVSFPGPGNEGSAYYTDDLTDAVDTAYAMRTQANHTAAYVEA